MKSAAARRHGPDRLQHDMRVDQLIVQRGLAPSRSAAQRLIERGAVRWRTAAGWAVPRKAGDELPEDCELAVTDDAELRFASRGGLKLDGALARCGIDAAGLVCLDVGQSTGGFTDALLQRGAAWVVGIDVGHGQLHPRLAADARVAAVERFNVRTLSVAALRAALAQQVPPGRPEQAGGATAFDGVPLAARAVLAPDFTGFDLAVADLSFIALAKVIAPIAGVLRDGGTLLALVKPQFEAGRAFVGKGGIVRDAAAYAGIERAVREAAVQAGLAPLAWIDSPIAGGDGNREFFLQARRPARAPAKDTAT